MCDDFNEEQQLNLEFNLLDLKELIWKAELPEILHLRLACEGIGRFDFETALDNLFRDIDFYSYVSDEEIETFNKFENFLREIQNADRKTTLFQTLLSKVQKDTYLNYGKLLISEEYSSVYSTPTSSQTNGVRSNSAAKSEGTSFTIKTLGNQVSGIRAEVEKVWLAALTPVGLTYQKFNPGDKNNWIGTVRPYLNFSGAFGLRLNELRLGHAQLRIEKKMAKSIVPRLSHTDFKECIIFYSKVLPILLKEIIYGAKHRANDGISVYATKQATIQREVGGCSEEINVNDNLYRRHH
ncbi:hypothetical protein CBL_10061 [Carabus blaptoides fortunei]